MAWRTARSLEVLRAQIDAMAPRRSKASDGTKASAEHSIRNPTSDHEPNAAGVVTALDITHDPDDGVDAGKIAEALIASRDPRIKYVISNARIASSKTAPWTWRPYNGSNAHRLHFHISVMGDPALYDDTRPWNIGTQMAITSETRRRMAQEIVNFEARRDAQGRLMIYDLPANDGGGAYEVAGINVRYHPDKAAQLRQLIQEGRQAEAETAVRDYLLEYTNAVAGWHDNPGVEFYLRDTCFNRGPTGAARILQRAIGVEVDGIVGPITREALTKFTPSQLLTALRNAREAYEREDVGYRANLWDGLVNRWNKAFTVAQSFAQEIIPPTSGVPATVEERIVALLQGFDARLARLEKAVALPPPADPQKPPDQPKPPPVTPPAKDTGGFSLARPGVWGSLAALAGVFLGMDAGAIGGAFGIGAEPTVKGTASVVAPALNLLLSAFGAYVRPASTGVNVLSAFRTALGSMNAPPPK